jgi:hypothetical protein
MDKITKKGMGMGTMNRITVMGMDTMNRITINLTG